VSGESPGKLGRFFRIAFNLCPIAIWRGDFVQAETLASILIERSQSVFEHYHEWGLLYRQFTRDFQAAISVLSALSG
jgi:hypothetical protein